MPTATYPPSTWNETQMPYPVDRSIAELVAWQARNTPEAIALVASAQTLSYRELNRRANQLAHALQSWGVGPDVLVGVCMERSLEMVVALLAILKAGGAYVPLDPAYPEERLAYMLRDAGAPVLLTQSALARHLPQTEAHIVYLDGNWGEERAEYDENPTSGVQPDNLIYVVYTSGSTGKPKGVEIRHRSLLNLIFWHRRAFAITAADRATQIASPAFDALGWELWPYLTSGASVYLIDEEAHVDAEALRDWLIQKRISITYVPTALVERLLALPWPAQCSLRFLLTGGDTLHGYPPPTLPFVLINNYGPTEATVVSTSGPVFSQTPPHRLPSIGRPIANTQIHILDEQVRQVPVGEPGEIYIGGIGLARGYHNRPDLTAERFVPDPFSKQPGARLYKTGDLARYRADGTIEFLGRLDYQVKIRGYRIELSEIEKTLLAHPAIEEAVTTVHEETSGDKRLVAYVVLSANAQTTASALQDFLSTSLPDYMIPSTIVHLEALPLSTNGKVDRAALPAPNPSTMLSDEVMMPTTTTEEQIAHLVAHLLEREQVGTDQDFFHLGGHSLLVPTLIGTIETTFGVRLPAHTIFENPTIKQLAEIVDTATKSRQEAEGKIGGK